jgi:hypothetical protein
MVELPDKSVIEDKTCTHNFAPDFSDPTVTILSMSFVKSMVRYDLGSGVLGAGFAIATPAAIPDVGAAALTISANQVVGQTVLALYGGGLEGNTYQVRCRVTGSDGQVLENVVTFTVHDSAA